MPYGNKKIAMGILVESLMVLLLAAAAILKMVRRALHGGKYDSKALDQTLSLVSKVQDLADGLGLKDQELQSFDAATTMEASLEGHVEELQAHHYKTNDIVCISGTWYGTRQLQVSGLRAIKLGPQAFLLMTILARHAKASPGHFITITDLLDSVAEEARGLSNCDGTEFWPTPEATRVYRLISALREEIANAGGNRLLLESSENHGGGWRLSTAPRNIILRSS